MGWMARTGDPVDELRIELRITINKLKDQERLNRALTEELWYERCKREPYAKALIAARWVLKQFADSPQLDSDKKLRSRYRKAMALLDQARGTSDY